MVEENSTRILSRVFHLKNEDDFQEAKLDVIDWRGNSPALNPIENL